MKASLAVLFCATTALAQTNATPAASAPGCGAAHIKFAVKTNKSQHPVMQPEKHKALIYFIEDDSSFESRPQPTTRLGVDGAWVGANHGDSYFYVSVDPGEHHLCASWQSFVALGAHETSAAVHFTAEAGQTYYFRVRNTWLLEHGVTHIVLSALDSDEGQVLTSRSSFSTSEPK